jgi:uncharacterized membrane protein
MVMNVHDLPATPTRLRYVAGRLGLGRRAYERAREIAGVAPDPQEWRVLIDRFLLIFGTALIVAGITAFFAYNWAGLHKFSKFGLIEAGIVASVGLAWWRGLDSGAGRSALFAAAFLVGVLFALYGQVYQTGADPYGLFVAWGLLVLGWVLIGNQAGLWMLLLVLTNLSVTLFWTQVLHPQPVDLGVLGPLVALSGTFTDARLADLVFALNASALVLWELLARRGVSWMQGRTFPRVVSLFALAPVVVSSLTLILVPVLDDGSGWHVLALLFFFGFASVSLSYFRFRAHDLFILTVCLLGGILMVTSLVARFDQGSFGMFLVLAALVVGQTTGAAIWLRRVSQEWEETG